MQVTKKGRDMKAARQSGFTLIELMIAVVIVGILASIAYPSYQRYVLSSRRAEAQADMLEDSAWLEKWRANQNTYSSNTRRCWVRCTNSVLRLLDYRH
jgi:type IV pilus assembly protein PilE